MREEYVTIKKECETETVIKGSRFIAVASPCSSESDLDSFLDRVRVKYPNATHYCYAAVFDSNDRFSDNGEPSGTAGRPMLQVLKGSGIDDVAVIAVRYFGGTLLGTGGLVQAYSGITSDVMTMIEPSKMVLCDVISFSLGYGEYSTLMVDTSLFSIVSQEFSDTVRMTVSVPKNDRERFKIRMDDITKGNFRSVDGGQIFACSCKDMNTMKKF